MGQGLEIRDAGGVVVWNSLDYAGGVVADVRTYAAGATATLTYPDHAGRNVMIVPLVYGASAGGLGVSSDTALGYPRVTVAAAASQRRFAVVVW